MNIAIVGAGLTGATLAHLLTHQGHRVTVFEKSRGRGGRLTHKRLPWANFNMGAPLFQQPRPKYEWVNQLLTELRSAGLVTAYHEPVFDVDQACQLYPNQDELLQFNGSMSALCQHYLNEVTLNTQWHVANIIRTNSGWQLSDLDSQVSDTFDRLIITAPWPQTRDLISEHIDDLPEQAWSSCWTLAFSTNDSFGDSLGRLNSETLSIQTLIKSPSASTEGEDVWIAYLQNTLSDQLDKCDPEKVVKIVLDDLNRIFKRAITVTNWHAHFWRYARPRKGESGLGVIRDTSNTLLAGGDWSRGASIPAALSTAKEIADILS